MPVNVEFVIAGYYYNHWPFISLSLNNKEFFSGEIQNIQTTLAKRMADIKNRMPFAEELSFDPRKSLYLEEESSRHHPAMQTSGIYFHQTMCCR